MAEIYFLILILNNIECVIAGYFNFLPCVSSAKKNFKGIFKLRDMIPKPS